MCHELILNTEPQRQYKDVWSYLKAEGWKAMSPARPTFVLIRVPLGLLPSLMNCYEHSWPDQREWKGIKKSKGESEQTAIKIKGLKKDNLVLAPP